jgi:RND family efflux transporter MFP subunit
MTLKKNHIVLIAILLAILVFFMFKLKDDEASDTTAKKANVVNQTKAALTITTVRPERRMMRQSIAANGSIAPWQEALIGAEVNGLQINQVNVNVGDIVKRGQVIAEFSATTILADIAQANATLADAQASAIEAAGNASRARSIQDTGALSKQQIEQFMAQEASTKARVAAAEATLLSNQIRLKQTKVLAPDNGVISARAATVGAVVSPGQELFRLIRQGRLEWRAELTSSEIGAIKQGMDAYLTMPSGEKVVGKVRMVSPMVDTQTRNAMVFVDLPANNQIKSGMFARGSFELGENESVTLPASALVLRDGFTYVMQIDKQTQDKQIYVRQIKVQAGKRVGDMVEIIDLENNMDHDYVATGGAFLADGDAVNVIGNTAPLEIKP